MPRYFFHVSHTPPDTEGTELADTHAARIAAMQLCGGLIRELDGAFWETPLWQLRVTDQDQQLLFTLTFSADLT